MEIVVACKKTTVFRQCNVDFFFATHMTFRLDNRRVNHFETAISLGPCRVCDRSEFIDTIVTTSGRVLVLSLGDLKHKNNGGLDQ